MLLFAALEMEIPTRMKAKGSPQDSSSITQHPSQPVYCQFYTSSFLCLPPGSETKAPAPPELTRGCYLEFLSHHESRRSSSASLLHNSILPPVCAIESRVGLQLTILESGLSLFHFMFQCRLHLRDAASQEMLESSGFHTYLVPEILLPVPDLVMS